MYIVYNIYILVYDIMNNDTSVSQMLPQTQAHIPVMKKAPKIITIIQVDMNLKCKYYQVYTTL